MAEHLSVDYINPFLIAAEHVLSQVCNIKMKLGRASKEAISMSRETLFILLGVTGEISGQVCLLFSMDTARDIACRMMMGMPVNEMDEMARSALSELGNMIMGNAATLLSNKGTAIDITPPTLGIGSAVMSSPGMTTIKMPLLYENGEISIYFLLKDLR